MRRYMYVSFTFTIPLSSNDCFPPKVRWFMCSEDDWRVDDGLFNKEEFFNVLVQLFESDPDDEWCKDTLAWWNL